MILKITADSPSLRLDVYLSEKLGISRSLAANMIGDGLVTVNKRSVAKKYIVSENDEIEYFVPEAKEQKAAAENIPIDIIYEDDYLLIVNKPRGMVVHPAAGNYSGTLVNALLHACHGRLSTINGVIRPGIVHRIDKDTGGILMVAKTDESHKSLAAQIAAHTVTRRYEAIVTGNLKNDSGTIDKPIGRHKTDRKKMTVTTANSKNAITHYRVIEQLSGHTFVECTLETGRTHQIRVHMQSIGHPLLGDTVYGAQKTKNRFALTGQALNAKFISFIHPISGEEMSFQIDTPRYMREILDVLRCK